MFRQPVQSIANTLGRLPCIVKLSNIRHEQVLAPPLTVAKMLLSRKC